MDIIRTRRDGCFRLRNCSWGMYLGRIDDPDANAEVTEEQLNGFELREGINKIPAELWARWIKLCFHFCEGEHDHNTLEVSVRLIRKEDDDSQWRILVPRQGVSSGSVDVPGFDGAMDIETGEIIESYPPAGWLPVGSSHSHNTMSLDRFSATDDHSELGDPGLHVLISHIDTKRRKYRLTASVTTAGRRFYVPFDPIIDATPIPESTFHPDVLNQITTGSMRSYGSAMSRVPWYSKDDGYDLFGDPRDDRRSRRQRRRDLIDAFHGADRSDEFNAGSACDAGGAAAVSEIKPLETTAAMQEADADIESAIHTIRHTASRLIVSGCLVDTLLDQLNALREDLYNEMVDYDWSH